MVYAGDNVYNTFERHPWLDALCDMHVTSSLAWFLFGFPGAALLRQSKG